MQSSHVIHTNDMLQKYMERMLQVKSKIQDMASDNILKAQARQKKNFDKRQLIPSFNIGLKSY